MRHNIVDCVTWPPLMKMLASAVLASLVLSSDWVWAQEKYTISQPYDFPIKPGTPAWADLHGLHGRIQACEMPTTVAKSMTTAALVETCMNYLLRGNISVYDTSSPLIEAFFNNFAGFKELALRTDAGTNLLAAYQAFN